MATDHRIRIVIDNSQVKPALAETEGGLRRVDGAAEKATQKVSLMGRAFNNMKTQVTSMTGALAGFSAGIAALLAVRTIAGFDDQMASVRAVTLATNEEFTKLRNTALEFGATTRFTATEAGSGLELLGRAGASANQAVGLLGTTLQLAQAEGLSLAESADFLVKVISGMRLELGDASKVADILSATASKTTTDVRELATAFRYAAAITAGFKTPIEEVAAALGVLAQNGQTASLGGTAIRGFLSRIASPTKEFAKDLKSVGLTVKDISPETNTLIQIVEKLAAAGLKTGEAFDLFKQRAGSGVEILVNNLPALKQLNAELKSVGGTLQIKTDIKADTLQADLLGALSAVQALVLAIGDAGLTRILRAAIQTFSALFRGLADAIDFIAPLITNIGKVFLVVFSPLILIGFIAGMTRLIPLMLGLTVATRNAAAAFALLTALGPMNAFIGGMGILLGLVRSLALAMLGIVAANPITAIIVAVGIAITVFQKWGNQIGVIGTNAATLADLWQAAMQRVDGYIISIKQTAADVFGSIQTLGGAAADWVAEKFRVLYNTITGFFGALGSGLAAIGRTIGQLTGLSGVGDSVKNLLGEADAIANEERIGAELRATRGVELQNAAKQKLAVTTRDLTGAEKAGTDALHEAKTARQDLLSSLIGPAGEALAKIAALNSIFESGAINASEYADQLQRLRENLLTNDQSVESGLLRGLNKVAEGATRIGDHISTVIQSAFSSASSAIAEFAVSGKLDFKSLTDSILKDLVRLATNQLFGQIANGLLAGLGGGAVGGSSLLPGLGFATGGGGIVTGNGGTDSQLVGPFRMSPGERFKVETPQQQRRGGGQTTVNVINNSGGPVEERRRSDSSGGETVEIIIGAVNKAMAGGKFDKAMAGRYGTSNSTIKR